MGNFGEFLKTQWKMPKLKKSNATFWVIFKHCVPSAGMVCSQYFSRGLGLNGSFSLVSLNLVYNLSYPLIIHHYPLHCRPQIRLIQAPLASDIFLPFISAQLTELKLTENVTSHTQCLIITKNVPIDISFNFAIFHYFLSYKKATCQLTLFDRKLQVFKNSPNLTFLAFLMNFCPLKM